MGLRAERVGGGDTDKMTLALDRHLWQTLVNAVINLLVP
jgi:hypothetical protein